MATIKLDGDLIDLAYLFLSMKGKPFTIVDTMTIAYKILRWSEKNHNRYQKMDRLRIEGGCIYVDEKFLTKRFRATKRPR